MKRGVGVIIGCNVRNPGSACFTVATCCTLTFCAQQCIMFYIVYLPSKQNGLLSSTCCQSSSHFFIRIVEVIPISRYYFLGWDLSPDYS